MSRPAQHQCKLPSSVYRGRPIDPCTTGYVGSPCRMRPENGKACPLLPWPKDNQVCYNCGVRLGTEKSIHPDIIREMIKTDKIEFAQMEKGKVLKCQFPGCYTRIAKGKYCTTGEDHSRLLNARRQTWKRRYGKDAPPPPLSWLHRKKKWGKTL